MSLVIAYKSAEGVVLAADSRVTLVGQQHDPLGNVVLIPATFDNASKLLSLASQPRVGAVTYGAGAIGNLQPRTASSFLPEFDAALANAGDLTVEQFATRLGDFFLGQWTSHGMPTNPARHEQMFFIVGGYDDATAAYGRLYEVAIPLAPVPVERHPGEFGAVWGGQREFLDRLVNGFDDALPTVVQDLLGIAPANRPADLADKLKEKTATAIPWAFLPLQDCVDLSIFLIRTTTILQTLLVGIRGVGGAVDVATITRTKGFKPVRIKEISGERLRYWDE